MTQKIPTIDASGKTKEKEPGTRIASRLSLAETVGETLGVTGVTGTEVVKRNIIFTLVLTAAIVVFLVAGSSLKFLMI